MTSSTRRGPLSALLYALLQRVWFVHPEAVIVVQASPALCLQTLALTAKPSRHRLEHRDLFVHGRRYHLRPVMDGFRLTTTSGVMWRYKRRTSASAYLVARFTELGENSTRINLRASIRLFYLLRAFFLPLFMTSILVYVPWQPQWIAFFLFLIYALSFFGYRYNAMYEANEMVFFVEKALADFVPKDMPQLAADSSNTITVDHGFSEVWDRFMQEHEGD